MQHVVNFQVYTDINNELSTAQNIVYNISTHITYAILSCIKLAAVFKETLEQYCLPQI